jgi:hypothetical protein
MGIKVDGSASGRRVFAVRVAVETPERLAELALNHGYYFIGAGGERLGAAGQLMDAIARGELVLGEEP